MGLFTYKYVFKTLQPYAQNYFTKRVDVHDHFIRVCGLCSLSVQYSRINYRRSAVSYRE